MVLGSDAAAGAACDDSSTSSYSSNWKLASITLKVQANPEINRVDKCKQNVFQTSKGFFLPLEYFTLLQLKVPLWNVVKNNCNVYSQENVVNLHYL